MRWIEYFRLKDKGTATWDLECRHREILPFLFCMYAILYYRGTNYPGAMSLAPLGLIFCTVFSWIYNFLCCILVMVFHEASMPSKKRSEHLYTRIRGKWYDMADFDHPGGPIALNLAKGRDSTALFESHHFFIDRMKLYGILSKYAVKEEELKGLPPIDDEEHYDWEACDRDIFVQALRDMVVEHFSAIAEARGVTLRQAAKATPRKWIMIGLVMSSFFATVPFLAAGQWWTLVLTPQLAWITIANYWHDGLHFALSCDWRINSVLPYLFPFVSSPWLWYHQHLIGHHAYTNIDHKDPDLAHAPQLLREHSSIKWRKLHETQTSWHRLAFVWSVSIAIGLQLLNDARTNLKLSLNNVVPYVRLKRSRLIAHILGRLLYIVLIYVWPFAVFPWGKAMIWAFVPVMLFSWSFMLNTQVNHLNADCAGASSKIFFKHQIVSSQNFGTNNWWCTFFSGGLNCQIEHHLFPCLNHCHLPSLAPKVRQLCITHGVSYKEVPGYREALKKHIDHLLALSRPP